MGTTYVKGWVDSNGAPGEASVPGTQGLYEESSSQKMALGFRVSLTDGRAYRYSYFVTATGQALLSAPDTSVNDCAESDNIIVAPASAQTTTDGTATYKYVEITKASVSANVYAGGYFITTDDTGEGYMYRIESNTATGDPASGKIRLTLKDPIVTTLDATTDFAIVGHTYANLHGSTAATDPVVSGVSLLSMTVDYYGFVQTWGPAVVLCDASGGAIAQGDIAALSDGVTGAFQLQDAYTEQLIGTVLFAPDDTGYGGVYLRLCW